MDRSKWETNISGFQARARGYLTRTEVRRAREDFEEIVREIDGGLSHLSWTDSTPSTPLFTGTGGVRLRRASRLLKPQDPKVVVSADSRSEEGSERCVSPERKEAKREGWSSIPVRGNEEEQQGLAVHRGAMMERTGRSSTIWSSAELDNEGYPQKGPQQYCQAQEVPRTGEELRLHRNTLTMELVWLQQAINSRRKYLSLKDRLAVP